MKQGHTCFTNNAPQVKFGGLFAFGFFFFLNNLIQGETKCSSMENQKANANPKVSSLMALTFQSIKIMQDGKELKER